MALTGSAGRTIFHLDMDAFFVSVEELSDPSLRGRPVVVGGKPNERGVVAAASYAARRFGVRSAMPLREAFRRCPQAVFLQGRPSEYLAYSRKVRSTLEGFSPNVSMASIDEAYLEMTGTERLLGPPLKAAHALHEAVRQETGLASSIGIGTSKLVAKICSGLAKPNGVLCVWPGAEAAFLAPLEIGRIPGVGRVAKEQLGSLGIYKIGDAAERGEEFLRRHLGKHGVALAGKAEGLDAGAWFSPGFSASDMPKSVSHETTFRQDTTDQRKISATVAQLTQLVSRRLREHRLWARKLQVKIRYSDFSTRTRSATLARPTQTDKSLLRAARALVARHHVPSRPVRLLGVQAFDLREAPALQPSLFGKSDRERWSRALRAVDAIRDRFGESSVGLAAAMGHGRRDRVHENPVGLPGQSSHRTGPDTDPEAGG